MRLEEVDKIVAEVYKEILHKIGTIHSENVFQNAFAFGLCERGIQNIKEYPVPVFFNNEAITSAPNLCAGIEEREPPNDPRAVLVAATITIS